ncbi:MAG: hypothetical protein PHN26_10170, partial [Eubacteriaceae bacterium]|nr:hypothetical protein [Eubacteriaceae bacterium]
NSLQPEKITLGDAFKDLKVTSVEAVPREKDPTTADQIAIKVEGDVNSDGMVGGQYVPDIYKKGTVQIDKSVLGTASDLNLETDVITPSITLKDLQADGKAVESIPADAKTVTGTLAVDSDVKDAGWFYASKTDGVISNPDSVAYLALGGALGSSTIALGSPSVTGTLKNEIPFTITLDANRSATGDGTITVPAEENCFGSSLSVTIPVATPEKAADTTTPTTNSTPSTTAATPQTTADQNLVTATPQTSLDQNAVVNKLTETVKNTPILSFLGTLTTGSIAVSNVQEYYAGSPVYTITLKAKGDYKFAAKLDAQQFKLQNALSEVTVNSISRVSDTEVRLDVTGNIVNGKNDQDGHQIVSYSDGSIQITKNQISGAAEDVTVSVPVSTPTAVLQNVKVDGSVAKTKDGRVTIDGNAKKISGDFVIEGADGASYWYRNGAAGQKDMCTSLVLGEAFAGATEVKCEVDPVQKNKIHFSFKLGDTEVSAITGTIQVDAKNNSFNQDLTAEMAVNTVSLSCTSLSCENVTDDPMKYTAVIKVNGSISLPITKDIIEFTDGFEACKITDVTYDQKADTITVKFTKARYLDTPAMEGSLKLRATKGQLRYSDGPVFSGVLSVALHDPVNHLKYKEDDPAKTTDTKSYSTMDWYKLSHFATNLLNKTICHIPSFIFSGKKDGDADYAKTHNVLMDVTNFFLGDIGKDLLGILTGWDVKTTTTPGLSNEMQLKAINATAQSNTEVLLGGMEKQTCFSKLQDIDNDINKLNIKDQLFNDAAKDAQIFGNYLNEVSEGKLEEDDEIVTSKDIDNNAQLKTDYQSIYSSDASSIIAYLGQTKTGSKTELLEAMKEFIK